MATGIAGSFDRVTFAQWLRDKINDPKRALEELSLRDRTGKTQGDNIVVVPIGKEQRTVNGINCVASEIEREAAFYAHQLGARVEYVVCAHYANVKRPMGSYAFYLQPPSNEAALAKHDDSEDRGAVALLVRQNGVLLNTVVALAGATATANDAAMSQLRQGYAAMFEAFPVIVQQLGANASDFAKDARRAHSHMIDMRVDFEKMLSEEDDRKHKRETRAKGMQLLEKGYDDLKGHAPALLAALSAGRIPLGDAAKHPAFIAIRRIVDGFKPEQLPAVMKVLTPEQQSALGGLIDLFRQADEEEKRKKAPHKNGAAPS